VARIEHNTGWSWELFSSEVSLSFSFVLLIRFCVHHFRRELHRLCMMIDANRNTKFKFDWIFYSALVFIFTLELKVTTKRNVWARTSLKDKLNPTSLAVSRDYVAKLFFRTGRSCRRFSRERRYNKLRGTYW